MALWFQRVRVQDYHGRDHDSRKAGRLDTKTGAENSHLETQARGRKRERERDLWGGY